MTDRANRHPSPPWEPGTRLISAVVLLVISAVLLYQLKALVGLFLIAFLIAFILFPLVVRIQRWLKSPRWVAVLIIYVLLLALIAGAGTGVGVAVSQSVVNLVSGLEDVVADIPAVIDDLMVQQFTIGPWVIDIQQYNFEEAVADLVGVVQSLLLESGTFLASLAGRAATTIGLGLTVFVFGFYLLLDFDRIGDNILRLVPSPYRADIRRLLADTGKLWSSFFRGQLILGSAVGLLTVLFLTILGTNFTLGLGVMAGILEFIPSFGPFISAVVGILVALFQPENWLGLSSFWYAVVVLGAFLLVQQFENNLLVPKIIGHSLNLPPLIVLLAVLAGGLLFGLFGVLIAAPVTATLRLWIGYIYRKTVGLDTWPSPVMETKDEVQMPNVPSFMRKFVARLTKWIRSSRHLNPFSEHEAVEEMGEEESAGDKAQSS